ncbi:MAG: response regulator [Clostridiales bacterium]|nr:response regulator [Clostridiales bacterium]
MYKVLIVDDERIIREGMKRTISWSELGVDCVLTAATGSEALSSIEQYMPEIMITDISMPEMSGLALIEKALEIVPEMRILVLTGYDRFDYAQEALRLHVHDFLVKPIDENVLSDSIRGQIEATREMENQRKLNDIQMRTAGLNAQIELEKVLNDLVHGHNKEKSVHFFSDNPQLLPGMQFVVVILAQETEINTDRQYGEIKFRQMESLCMELFDAKSMGITVRDRKGERLFIVLSLENCDQEAEMLVADLLDILKDEYGAIPKAAIGNRVIGIEQIDTSYQDALYLLRTEQKNIHAVLQPQNVIRRRHMFLEVFEEMKREMCANVNDFSFVMHVFDSFCTATDSYNLSASSVRNYCFELLAAVTYTYRMSGGNETGKRLDDLIQALNGADQSTCMELGKQYLLKMLGGEENEIHEIVAKAKRYINAHLAEELSVGSIADSFFVSPNYFSRLFKRTTGMGCNEYIVSKRIEKACLLLETTNFNTGKIAMMVGYNDTNYFSMTFKKHCRVSPTRYRSDRRRKEGEQTT